MRVLWLCVLAALVAAPAWAQYPEGSKNRQNDGNARLVVTDASDTTNVLVKEGGVSGALSMDDADRDRDQVWQHLAALNTNLYSNGSSNPNGGYMDSTSALDTRGWNKLGLYFYPQIQDTLTTTHVLIAVQVRGHYAQASDSLSTFAAFPRRQNVQLLAADVAALARDTLSTAQSDWNEITALATTALPTEFIIPFYASTSNPRGRFVPLDDIIPGFWAPYTSVRVRFIRAYDVDSAVVGRMTLRLDVIGGR